MLQLVLQEDGALGAALVRGSDGYAIDDVALGWRHTLALGTGPGGASCEDEAEEGEAEEGEAAEGEAAEAKRR